MNYESNYVDTDFRYIDSKYIERRLETRAPWQLKNVCDKGCERMRVAYIVYIFLYERTHYSLIIRKLFVITSLLNSLIGLLLLHYLLRGFYLLESV